MKITIKRLKEIIREELINEKVFGSQAQYDAYRKKHNLKPGTKVKVAGKTITVRGKGKLSKKAKSTADRMADKLNKKMAALNKKRTQGKVTENENISTVFLNGEIDMDIADNVREVIFPLIDSGKEVHLNMKDVQYMDSSGISVIVESNQRAKEKNTKVELKEVSQPVEKVLAMARKFL